MDAALHRCCSMNPERVAVATIAWARDAAEEQTLERALSRLAACRLPIAVADRGTSPAFTASLERLCGVRVVVPEAPGLVRQVQASLAIAAQFRRPWTLYVEPDKEAFFAHGLLNFIERAPDVPEVGVVVAARSPDSFATFPPMQRYAEGVINTLCAEVTRSPGDYSYGPFLLAEDLRPVVGSLDAALGWGWRHATFTTAARAGLRLVHVAGDYACPMDQRVEDEAARRHRMRQLSENLQGLLA